MPQQVCMGAMLKCSFGAAPSSLVVLPKNLSDEDREQLGTIAARYADNPRTELRW